MSYKQKLKPSVTRDLLIALFIAGGFAQTFPIIGLALIFAMVPGITDLIWGIAQLPIFLFGISLPENDKAGHTLVIAGRIYGVLIFALVFYFLRRLDWLARNEQADRTENKQGRDQ